MLEMKLVDTIVLKIVEKRHAREMFAWTDENRKYFEKWIPMVSKTHDVAKMEELILRYLDKFKDGTGAFYGLWDSGKMMGLVLVRDINVEAKCAEIGYMISSLYEGRGIIKAACARLIDYLFGELGMQKIVIRCDDRNERSIGLAKKLGFAYEGNLRRDMVINGEYCNTMYFGLLKEEYKI